jgi:hypothetical protein
VSPLAGGGGADYVISSFQQNYDSISSQASADFQRLYQVAQNKALSATSKANSSNATNTTNTAVLTDVPSNLKAKLDNMDKQIAILQVAIQGAARARAQLRDVRAHSFHIGSTCILRLACACAQGRVSHLPESQAIAITGVVFGIVGLSMALFTTCRIFIHSSLWGGAGAHSMVTPGSMTAGSSVRRQKSLNTLSEGSFH